MFQVNFPLTTVHSPLRIPVKNDIFDTLVSGEVRIEIYVQNETIGLTQQNIARLFGVSKSTISWHLSNIFESGELEKEELSGNSEQFK